MAPTRKTSKATDEISFIQPDGSYKEDIEGLTKVLEKAEQVTDRPHFIKVDTLIAWPTPGKTNDPSSHGSALGDEAVAALKKVLGFDPAKTFEIDEEALLIAWPTPGKTNDPSSHGSALGDEAVAALKKVLGFDPAKTFEIDEEALSHAPEVAQRGDQAHPEWDEALAQWRSANPDKAALYDRIKAGELPEDFDKAIDDLEATFEVGSKVATRKASGAALNAVAAVMPELWGGSADLGGSNNTNITGAQSFAPAKYATTQWPNCSIYGRQLHFGVREFASGCITNGILLGSDT